MKRIFAVVLAIVMCSGMLSMLAASAGTETGVELPEVIYWEDFTKSQSTGSINTSGDGLTISENNGMFVSAESGSYSFEDGTLKFNSLKKSGNYFDIRLKRGSIVEKDLAQDFVLSFRLKSSVSNLDAAFSFKSEEEKSGTVDTFKIKKGKFYVGNTAANTTASIPANEWVYLELAFNYNENAKADNATYTGGAIDSYTVMLNGQELYTVQNTVLIQNYDFFRVFRYTGDGVALEIDDIRIALGSTSLKVFDENGGVKKDDYTTNVSWINELPAVTDYAYSFCFVGDTQMVARFYPDNMADIYDWIVANVQSKKIAHVFGLGDITDSDVVEQWTPAKAGIDKLNGVVPYSLVRGNHDNVTSYNSYFNNTAYTSQFEGFYQAGQVQNSWRRLDVGGEKYLLITLDNGPKDDVLAWADGIIKANADRKVIITTHAYLSQDGDTLRGTNNGGPDSDTPTKNGLEYNDGYDIWNELIYENPNVFMVVGGHIDIDRVVTTKAVGKHGNEVIQMLIDPQSVDRGLGATGMVTMLYFSEDGKSITVQTYSTVRDQYYMEENQYTIDVVEFELGATGSVGKDGKDGVDGKDGKDGADGLTPYIGENGNWWIGDTDTGIKAAGENGKDGKDGVDGKDGADAVASGCGGSIGAGVALVCLAAAGACALTKKKKTR